MAVVVRNAEERVAEVASYVINSKAKRLYPGTQFCSWILKRIDLYG